MPVAAEDPALLLFSTFDNEEDGDVNTDDAGPSPVAITSSATAMAARNSSPVRSVNDNVIRIKSETHPVQASRWLQIKPNTITKGDMDGFASVSFIALMRLDGSITELALSFPSLVLLLAQKLKPLLVLLLSEPVEELVVKATPPAPLFESCASCTKIEISA